MTSPTSAGATDTFQPPEGFQLLRPIDGFIGVAGPYYRAAGGLYGFQSDARHGNPNGVLHGGAILTFVDTVLGREVVKVTRRRCATVALNSQFMAAARPGDWIEAKVVIRKLTGSMAFVDAEVTAAGEPVLSATSIYRIFSAEIGAPSQAAPAAGATV
ncbi:MAG: PaaI family thioesterase [Phreatobacter sp.]|jgi:acyl-coenzyme A thioesterase PaaI-like protein